MLYQVIGKLDPRKGLFNREMLLGCIRIDEANLSQSAENSRFAFYAFLSREEGDARFSYCTKRDLFLVVSGYYPHLPGSKDRNEDVLFFYQTYDGDGGKNWKFLRPGSHGGSETGLVILGAEALDKLKDLLQDND